MVGKLGDWASHDGAVPELDWETLNWETKESAGGDGVNWRVVINGLKLPTSTQNLDMA